MKPPVDELQMKIDWLKVWAADQKCVLQDRGEVGFGRPCVGIFSGNTYVDLGPPATMDIGGRSFQYPDVLDEAHPPEGVDHAYHKHDCLAVLAQFIDSGGDGGSEDDYDYDAALAELFIWVQHIDRAGLVVKSGVRHNDSDIAAMLHGPTIYYLEKP